MRWPALLIWCLLLLLPAAEVPAKRYCDKGVCLDVYEGEAGVVFQAENGLPAPVHFRLQIPRLENLSPGVQLPVEQVIPAGQRTMLLGLRRNHADVPYLYRFQWRFGLGDPAARHDPALLYHIPFGGGEARKLTQGVGGGFSHSGRRSYAFDFTMPIGTPVLAARAGTVAGLEDGHGEGGPHRILRDRANLVAVEQSDGTFGEYVHLRRGLEVELGARVEVGDLLGYSGNSGYTTAPHLHFHVWKRASDGEIDTLPIRFATPGGESFVPATGVLYRPQRPPPTTGTRTGSTSLRDRMARRSSSAR